MAKANKKAKDLESVTNQFSEIIRVLADIAEQTAPLMPLVADSLEHTKKLVKMYKESWIRGLE